MINLFSFFLSTDRIQAISVDSPSFWSDGVIFRCANQPLESVVPCFLQDFVNQVITIHKHVRGLKVSDKLMVNCEYQTCRTSTCSYGTIILL